MQLAIAIGFRDPQIWVPHLWGMSRATETEPSEPWTGPENLGPGAQVLWPRSGGCAGVALELASGLIINT